MLIIALTIYAKHLRIKWWQKHN